MARRCCDLHVIAILIVAAFVGRFGVDAQKGIITVIIVVVEELVHIGRRGTDTFRAVIGITVVVVVRRRHRRRRHHHEVHLAEDRDGHQHHGKGHAGSGVLEDREAAGGEDERHRDRKNADRQKPADGFGRERGRRAPAETDVAPAEGPESPGVRDELKERRQRDVDPEQGEAETIPEEQISDDEGDQAQEGPDRDPGANQERLAGVFVDEDVGDHNVEKDVGDDAGDVAPVRVAAVLVVDAVPGDGKDAADHLDETRREGEPEEPVFPEASEDVPENQQDHPAVDKIEEKEPAVSDHEVRVPPEGPHGCDLVARFRQYVQERVLEELVDDNIARGDRRVRRSLEDLLLHRFGHLSGFVFYGFDGGRFWFLWVLVLWRKNFFLWKELYFFLLVKKEIGLK